MRVLVIGCGSIGSRRARLLAEMGHDLWIADLDPPAVHDLGGALLPLMAVPPLEFCGAYSAPSAIDGWRRAFTPQPDAHIGAALICTPPDTHAAIALDCLRAGIPGLFIEKPLAMDTDRLRELTDAVAEAGAVSMVACNLRFDARLRDLAGVPIQSATLRMGQHARYWSPTHQPTSLILDSIHELDLAVHLLGPIGDIAGTSDEDAATVEVTHLRGHSTLLLDRVTDPPVRTVTVYDGHKERAVNLWPPDPEMYRREMQHFLDCVERRETTCHPVEQAAEMLRWALEVA